jgi:large subunit ribosomal protein L43
MNAAASSSRAARAAIAKSVSIPGYNHFNSPLRKLIIDYHPDGPSQQGVRWVFRRAYIAMQGTDIQNNRAIRSFIRKPLLDLAREHPDVEILVRKIKQGKAAVLRGHYGVYRML